MEPFRGREFEVVPSSRRIIVAGCIDHHIYLLFLSEGSPLEKSMRGKHDLVEAEPQRSHEAAGEAAE
jgi:hypothetical protein